MGFNHINRVVILSIYLISGHIPQSATAVSALQPKTNTLPTTLEESKTFSKTSLRSFGSSPIIESHNVTTDRDSSVEGKSEGEKVGDSDHGDRDNEFPDGANGDLIREDSDEDDDVDSEGSSSVDGDLMNEYNNDDEYDDGFEEVDDHPDDEQDNEDDDEEDEVDDEDEEEDTVATSPPTTTKTPGQHHLITDRENASIQIGNDGKVYMFVEVNENYDPNVGYLDLDNNTKLLINIGDDDDDEEEEKLSSENSDTEDKSGNNKVLPVMVAEGSHIGGDGSLILLDNGGESGNKEIDGEAKKSKNTNNIDVKNILPEFPDDTQFSVGWSAATLSYDDLKNLLERNDEDDLGIISTTTSYDDLSSSSYSSVTSSVTYYYTTEGSENDSEDEDNPNIVTSMTDEELKNFLKKYKDLIETGEDYETETDPEEPMTLFTKGSESDIKPFVKGEGETMTQNDGDDETYLGTTTETETKNTSKSDQPPYLDRIFEMMMKDENLTEEEKSYLRNLERIRKLARSLGGIEALKNDSVSHHIVRRQLRGTEACGSFSKRRRRSLETPSGDLRPQEDEKILKSSHLNIIRFPPRTNTLNDIRLQAKTNSHPSHYKSTKHRSKRGVSNVGRRLEMGNPGFRQLYNQYKHMCNFIAMVAFEK